MQRRIAGFGLLILPALLALFFGCGGDDGPTNPPQPTTPPLVSGDLDGDGGELIHDDVVLTVPGGALDETADLAIYPESDGHPFEDDLASVYRISGLPSELGTPVTLRFRHGRTLEAGDSLTCFLGEEREAYSFGSGLSWHAVAGRDSAGWAIVEMERGALDLGEKAEEAGDVQATATTEVTQLTSSLNRFRVWYNPDEVTVAATDALLLDFDRMYTALTGWGFEFGEDDTIWPLNVYIREPIKSIACYVTAPHGKGHFDIDPSLVQPGIALLPVIAHETLHCAQTFYDPRDPEEWGVLNQERLWLDEATAAYLESVSNESEDVYPIGMDDENYAALFSGIAGHPYLENDVYGYGMASFFMYLAAFGNPEDAETQILQLFQHFKTHGNVTDAIDAVISPPVSSWCVDMHRKLAQNEIYPSYAVFWFWHQWRFGAYLESEIGATDTGYITVPDLGADICKFVLEGEAPESLSSLLIEARREDAQLSAEELPLSIYGHALNEGLTPLGTGVGEMMIDDWPALYETYEEILVMVSRPYSTAPGHTGKREIAVTATVRPDLSMIDVTTFNGVNIEVATDALVSNVGDVVDNYRVSTGGDIAWNGAGFSYYSNDDTLRISLNPETLTLGGWYCIRRGETIGGSYYVRRLGGHGVPLDSWEENSLVYRLRGAQVCDYLTHMFESLASDEQTDPYRMLLDYSCSDGETILDQSSIYLHLYRR